MSRKVVQLSRVALGGAKGQGMGWEQRWLWNVTLGNHYVWVLTFSLPPTLRPMRLTPWMHPMTPVAMLRAESCLRSAFLYNCLSFFEDNGRQTESRGQNIQF